MKAALILLVLVVLGGCEVATPQNARKPRQMSESGFIVRGYWVVVGNRSYGFADHADGGTSMRLGRTIYASPFPFTATQSVIGFWLILATLIFLPVVLTLRWKKKRALA
jgi:hypothetical protein